jgi:DNA-binding NarL/FixJ family response regulator
VASILIVEDDFLQAEAMDALLSARGHSVCAIASTAEQALYLAKTRQPDVVLMDVRLRGRLDGVDAATLIGEACTCGFVFVTGVVNAQTARRIGSSAPHAVTLMKPTTGPKLADAIDRALAGGSPVRTTPPRARRRAS